LKARRERLPNIKIKVVFDLQELEVTSDALRMFAEDSSEGLRKVIEGVRERIEGAREQVEKVLEGKEI
jgi:hypothetical protein